MADNNDVTASASGGDTTEPVLFYAFHKASDAPSGSGYCQKLETFLRASGTPYKAMEAMANTAPKGKLPYIVHRGVTVPDSDFAIQHLVVTGAARDLNEGLTPVQVATSRAWQAYIEEKIYQCISYERFTVDANYEAFMGPNLSHIPWPVRPVIAWNIRRNILGSLWGHGVGRHTLDEVRSLLTRAAADIEAQLAHGQPYFLAGTTALTEIDVIACGFLANALASYANPITREQLMDRPLTVAYAHRLTKQLFPEYASLLAALEAAQTGCLSALRTTEETL